ncbi:hypothetical protein DID75_01370 [Candidatus Marinamargulisbacteria bacterium SCGC AG-410-N11]|nr:hypothetical protein DID75_01370 [Candidatus Marinamargulisbacteria bacterium SCGC AG-410-N11]
MSFGIEKPDSSRHVRRSGSSMATGNTSSQKASDRLSRLHIHLNEFETMFITESGRFKDTPSTVEILGVYKKSDKTLGDFISKLKEKQIELDNKPGYKPISEPAIANALNVCSKIVVGNIYSREESSGIGLGGVSSGDSSDEIEIAYKNTSLNNFKNDFMLKSAGHETSPSTVEILDVYNASDKTLGDFISKLKEKQIELDNTPGFKRISDPAIQNALDTCADIVLDEIKSQYDGSGARSVSSAENRVGISGGSKSEPSRLATSSFEQRLTGFQEELLEISKGHEESPSTKEILGVYEASNKTLGGFIKKLKAKQNELQRKDGYKPISDPAIENTLKVCAKILKTSFESVLTLYLEGDSEVNSGSGGSGDGRSARAVSSSITAGGSGGSSKRSSSDAIGDGVQLYRGSRRLISESGFGRMSRRDKDVIFIKDVKDSLREYYGVKFDGVKPFYKGDKGGGSIKGFEVRKRPSSSIRVGNSITGSVHEFSASTLQKYQNSFKCVVSKESRSVFQEFFPGETMDTFVKRVMSDGTKSQEEAFLMKFIARTAQTPILKSWKGEDVSSNPDNLFQISMCGVDFDNRKNDIHDMLRYTNCKSLKGDRTGTYSISDDKKALLEKDLLSMAKARFKAYEQDGVEHVTELFMGQGVFLRHLDAKSNQIVREAYAKAIKQCLEDLDSTSSIKTFAMCKPTESIDYDQDFQTFRDILKTTELKKAIQINIVNNDILCHAADMSLIGKTSYLNPADSVGFYGQWWESAGGGAVEEGFATRTLGLWTQHCKLNNNIELGRFPVIIE